MQKTIVILLAGTLTACGLSKSATLLNVAAGDSSPVALQTLETDALSVLSTRCTSCHNTSSPAGTLGQADDKLLLLSEGFVVPGDHVNSLVYQVITADHDTQAVVLTAEEKQTVRSWIDVALRSLPLPTIGLAQTRGVLEANCTACHSPAGGNTAGVNLTGIGTIRNVLTAGQPGASRVFAASLSGKMPPTPSKLDTRQLAVIYNWILAGAAE